MWTVRIRIKTMADHGEGDDQGADEENGDGDVMLMVMMVNRW